jgi:Protein of unknown function (DUF998)
MARAITTPRAGPPGASSETTTRRARALLTGGVAAGPVFIAVVLLQARIRDGFDLTRHAVSLLSNGHLGWIQIGSFLVTGLLTIACAVGMRGVLGRGPGGTWGPRLVGVYGAGLICAGAFRADPADGFPRGTPPGQGEVSWHGVLHMLSFGVGFLCLIAACFVVARGLAAVGQPRSAAFSRISGSVILVGVGASFATSGSSTALAALWVAVVVAWAWLAVTATRLREPTAAPNSLNSAPDRP